MDTILQDLRFAIRTLTRSPMFTALCVLCLAIGIGLNANIYSAVYAVMLRPFPFARPEQLVSLQERQLERGAVNQTMSWAAFKEIRNQSTSFDAVAGYSFRSITITDTDEPVRLQGQVVTANLFPVLGVRPHLGRWFREDEDRVGATDVVILGFDVWDARYGRDSTIIGRILPINGLPHEVVGVMPKGFKFPQQEEAWIPMVPRVEPRGADVWDVQAIARRKASIGLGEANTQLAAISRRIAATQPAMAKWQTVATPIREAFIDSDTRLVILAMFGAVTFVLLIACANVANLLLARATSRGREIAVRSAIGAGHGRIVRQLLTESVLLAMIACPIGIGIAYWLLDIVLASIPDGDMPYFLVFDMNGWVLLYTVGIAAFTGIVFGLAPALQAVGGNLQGALRDGGRGSVSGGARQRLRTSLAVAEVALSVVLLIGASLFVRSFMNLKDKSGGVDAGSVMTMRVFHPGTRYDSASAIDARVHDLMQRIEAVPGVIAAAASNQIPLGGGGSGGQIVVEGRDMPNPTDAPFAEWTGVTAHWFTTLGIPILRGRAFTDEEARTRSPVAVVGERMASRFWPDADPVGRRFRFLNDAPDAYFTVIGVSRDYATGPLGDPDPAQPGFLLAYPHLATRNTGIMVRTAGAPAQITNSVRQAIRASDPTLPVFDARTMEEVRVFGFWSVRLFGWMFAMFGIIALVLASVGVYGVLAYNVSQRTQEIGVRLALGAQPDDVVRLVLRSGATLAGAGIVIGLAGAFGLTRVIQSLLVDVSASDAVSFAGVTVFLAAVALVASYVPARRATRVDPLTALRSE